MLLLSQYMPPSLRLKLLSMSPDALATINCAFVKGFWAPEFFAEHRVHPGAISGMPFELHEVRIGYVTFVALLVDGHPGILWDASLNDGSPIYPASSRGASNGRGPQLSA